MPDASRPLILFAHGAGAPSTSAWMRDWTTRLGALGEVVTFDYPYMKAGRKAPDKPPILIAAHAEALAAARKKRPRVPCILAGKSMGSRIGCHLAVDLPEAERPAAIVCFGYPLRSPAGTLRDEVLLALRTPILFVAGTRDPLCPLDRLAEVRARMKAPSDVLAVEGGDHSLAVRKRDLAARRQTQRDVDAAILVAVATFVLARSGGHA